jgi:hypothetical protein
MLAGSYAALGRLTGSCVGQMRRLEQPSGNALSRDPQWTDELRAF